MGALIALSVMISYPLCLCVGKEDLRDREYSGTHSDQVA